MKKYLAVSLLLVITFFACSRAEQERQNKETSETTKTKSINQQIIEKGSVITSHIQQVLADQLRIAIQDSGIAHALKYCNLKADPLTDSISNQFNVDVKRVSHKVRNADNMVNLGELGVIGNFQKQLTDEKLPQPIVEETSDKFTYYAPILVMAPLCLKCHGLPNKDIAPEDFIVINMLYPEDNASGFRLNELRGMWRVDFDKSAFVN